MRCRWRIVAAAAAATLIAPAAACRTSPACASTQPIEVAAGKSGTGSRPPSNSGSRTPKPPSRTVNPPSNSGQKSSRVRPPSNSGQTRPGSSVTKTGGKYTYRSPTGTSYRVPNRVTSRRYSSPTGTVYVIHTHGYYHQGGFHDIWDPYDWTNFYNPLSPWYQHGYYGRAC